MRPVTFYVFYHKTVFSSVITNSVFWKVQKNEDKPCLNIFLTFGVGFEPIWVVRPKDFKGGVRSFRLVSWCFETRKNGLKSAVIYKHGLNRFKVFRKSLPKLEKCDLQAILFSSRSREEGADRDARRLRERRGGGL